MRKAWTMLWLLCLLCLCSCTPIKVYYPLPKTDGLVVLDAEGKYPGKPTNNLDAIPSPAATDDLLIVDGTVYVYITQGGKAYHRIDDCGNMRAEKAKAIPLAEAKAAGRKPCSRCHPSDFAEDPVSATLQPVDGQTDVSSSSSAAKPTPNGTELVYITEDGTAYHRINDCGNMNPDKANEVTVEDAVAMGRKLCSRCRPPS